MEQSKNQEIEEGSDGDNEIPRKMGLIDDELADSNNDIQFLKLMK